MAATAHAHHELPLDALRLDVAIQARERLDDDTISDYADAMIAGDRFPAVVAFFDGTIYLVADGFHRVHAARRACVRALDVDVRDGTRRDALLYAASANQAHGLRRTNADKRRAVSTLLQDDEWRQWSDREIARRCGVSHLFVADLRRSLATVASDDRERTYTTKHGTVTTMDTSRIGRSTTAAATSPAPAPEPSRLAVHFSSETPEHYTPAAFLELVYEVFGGVPDLDPCAESHHSPNVPARRRFTRDENGLVQPWAGTVFMNPPYGREIGAWIEKLRDEWQRGEIAAAIALLPARPDTEWFDVLTADTDDAVFCFLHGRLTFIGNTDPAPFPSVAAYFGGDHDKFAHVFWRQGICVVRPPRDFFVDHLA